MAADEVRTVPVLIVGAGPAGLVSAIQLAHRGVASLVVERRSSTSTLPRATAVSTRTMEILRSWGLEDAIRAGAVDVDFTMWVTETLAAPRGETVSLGYPTRGEAAAISPTAPTCAPQDHLEPVLLLHLLSTPVADVRFDTELVTLEQDEDGVTAMLRDVRNGRSTVVRSRFVIGADGAHSGVRSELGVPMEGPDDLVGVATALFEAPLWRVLGERRHAIYAVTEPESSGVFVPTGPADRWVYGQDGAQGRHRPEDYTTERLVELIRKGSGVPNLEPRILTTGTFSFAAQVAERYRQGRVFLAGDAAHRITPRGGTGMNTAIHDAYDLGWKLAWVLNGWAGPGLLDRYEQERRPIGVRNTARSADPDGSRREIQEALPADLNGRMPHAWVWPGVSTLDLLGPGFTVLTGPEGPAWRQAAGESGSTAPISVQPVGREAADVLGIGDRGAVLVRPDAQVAARWDELPDDPAAALRGAIAGLIGVASHV